MKNITCLLVTILVLLISTGCYFEIITSPPASTQDAPTNQITQTAQTSKAPINPTWTAPKSTINAPSLPSIADVVEKGNPSVVTISTEQYISDIFRRPVTQKGAGSGWILDKNGIIVTNNHVVEGANKILIQLADGRAFEGNSSSVSRDPVTDLAVIKVDLVNLPVLTIGDSSNLRVGDWVVAIGNPLGKGIRAKEGTISGLQVSLSIDEEESIYDLIETSAAINPGNSGGPLLNMKGEVIGITSAKIAEVGVEGLGYAININSAMPILQELITKGYITRPYLGAELYTVDEYVAYYNNLGVKKGAVITFVALGSPAATAGLKRLDVITRFHGKDITSAPELLRELRNSEIGQEVSITFVRGSNTLTTTIVLSQTPPPR